MVATGVRISCDAVEINSVCSPSSASSLAISRNTMIRSPPVPSTVNAESAIGERFSEPLAIRVTWADSRG